MDLLVLLHQEVCGDRFSVLYLDGVNFHWEVLREVVFNCLLYELQSLVRAGDVWFVGPRAARHDPHFVDLKAP